MDHSAGFAPRGGAERVVKVDCGLGIVPRGVLENAAIQCGASEPVIALERTGVITKGLVGPPECLEGQGSVEVALGRVLRPMRCRRGRR